MSRLVRVMALVVLSVPAWPGGWGGAAVLEADPRDRPALTLKLTRGVQTTEPIKLAGARNEHLFLPVRLEGDASALTIQVKARQEGEGLRWQFYQVVGAPPESPGKFPPDALWPLEENHPGPGSGPRMVWVNLKIPATCPPGLHPLTLVFSAGEGNVYVPVNLRVYRFVLPDDLPITLYGGFRHEAPTWSRGGLPLKEAQVIKAYYRSLREYKFNALGGAIPFPLERLQAGMQVEDFPSYHHLIRYVLNDLKFNYFQIPKVRSRSKADLLESDFVDQARRLYPLFADYLRRQGWEGRALNYLVDEPQVEHHDAVLQVYALAKSLAPGVRTLSAGWSPSPEFVRVIDIWAHQAARYRPEEAEAARRGGQEVWLYANRLHGSDHPLVHQRLIGWLLHRYKFSGYLLWGVNFWPENPWTSLPGPQNFYRRGTFYYPHPGTGMPVPTTRLEALRRGFQDYQYLALLAQAYQQGLAPRERYEAIQARVDRLTEHLAKNPFPASMGELEALRLEIGELLDQTGAEPR